MISVKMKTNSAYNTTLLFTLNVRAGFYGDQFTECLLNNTSERDKIILVKWMFIGMGQHPILKREFPIYTIIGNITNQTRLDKIISSYQVNTIGKHF